MSLFILFAAMAGSATAAAPAGSGSSANSTNSTSPYQYQNPETEAELARLNESLGHNYLWSMLAVGAIIFALTTSLRVNRHIRHLTSMGSDGSLRFFSIPDTTMGWIKSNLIYAPILHYRRAREIKFSKTVNLGTLPTRSQAIFITLVIIANFFTCTWNIPWSDPQLQVLPILRNRTGTLSVVNLIPIMVMATVKNPLIQLLDISYDTFNLMHRWLGRLSILQAIAHTLCWMIAKVQKTGWSSVTASFTHSQFIYSGLIATIGFTVILLQSPKLFRNLAYEFFLHFHFVLVIMILVFLWIHLIDLPQQKLLLGAIILWAGARAWRLATLLFRSVGKGGCKATVESLPGEAVKISFTSPRPWTYRPGQSLYLTIPSIGIHTAHPFSVAWSGVPEALERSDSTKSYNEKKPIIKTRELSVEQTGKETLSLVIKKQGGFTKNLFNKAVMSDGPFTVNAYVEGPYGGEKSMSSYGNVMLFASGVGITHQLPYVKDLVEGYGAGTVATRRITLVWVIPDTDCLDWIRTWMHEVLQMEGRREVLKVLLYVTRASLSKQLHSPSETVRLLRGRPDVQTLMRNEANLRMGCMGVSVCAGGGLADEVRRASRLLLDDGTNLDFIEEGFGW